MEKGCWGGEKKYDRFFYFFLPPPGSSRQMQTAGRNLSQTQGWPPPHFGMELFGLLAFSTRYEE
jgi:hypothetical protein